MAELRSARVVGDTSLWQLRGRCDDLSRGGSPRKQQMFMRSLEINARHRRHRTSGFSLVEMTIVVAITITLTVVAVITLVPLLQAQHVTNAYNMTLAALRQARDNAVSQRTSYSVTFANKVSPSPYATIAVAWAPASGETSLTNGTSNGLTPATVTYQLSTDVSFLTPPAGTTSPDGYGTGTHAIDFGYTASSSTGEQPPFTSVRTVRSRTRICAPDSETGTGASSTWGAREMRTVTGRWMYGAPRAAFADGGSTTLQGPLINGYDNDGINDWKRGNFSSAETGGTRLFAD